MIPVQLHEFTSHMRRKSDRYPVVRNGIFLVKSGELMYQDKMGESITLTGGDFLLYSSGDISKIDISTSTGNFTAESFVIDNAIFQRFISYTNAEDHIGSTRESFKFNQSDRHLVSLLTILKEQLPDNPSPNTVEFMTLTILSEMVNLHPELLDFIYRISVLTISQQLIRYVEQNIASDLTIDTVAPKLGMSSSTLKRKLQSDKLSFANLVKVKRINHAATQLRVTRKTITEIAYETGFKTAAHFSTTFKAVTKMTPKEFREQIHA